MCEDSNCKKVPDGLCPAKGIIDIVSKKWTICIISLLVKEKPLRYNEIKKKIEEISPKSLSDHLKVLEKEGLIERKVYPEIPPRVEYSLTDEGVGLKIALNSLVEWVRKKKDNEE